MPRFKEQAICIRLIDWSETSQIVALLTENHGLVRGVAKGSKRTSPSTVARYSGGFELLTSGQVVGVIKRSSDLATLTEWDLQEPYWHLHHDLQAQRLGCYAADLIRSFVPELEPHQVVFTEMLALLDSLEHEDRHGISMLRFQWRLLDDCGYLPRIDVQPGRERYLFDARAGGFDESNQATNESHVASNGINQNGRWVVRGSTVHALQTISDDHDETYEQPTINPTSINAANRLLCAYARTILDRELPTMRFVLEKE